VYMMADYFSETFARMSVAYAASHADEPAEPGPAYMPTVEGAAAELTEEERVLLALPQTEFEAHICTMAEALMAAEAAEAYTPEEADGINSYSGINAHIHKSKYGYDIWHTMEDDSVNFFHGGDALGVADLLPILNAEGQIDQDKLNAAVSARLAAPPGGYERAFEKDARIMRIIGEYVKAHAEGPKEEHYREIVYRVKMEAAEAAAAARVEELSLDIKARLTELGLEHFESSASCSA